MKRISVIIPVYNAGQYIKRCIESIVHQLDLQRDELIIINDGSTDDSVEVIRALENKYANIRFIDKENEGIAKTRNLGILEAEGEYVCFIDDDDYVDKDYIYTLYSSIIESDADLVCSGYRRVDDERCLFSQKGIDSEWFKLMVITPWAKIYKRNLLIEKEIEFLDYPIGEDMYFNFRVYAATGNIKIIPYTGYNWFLNVHSYTNTKMRGFDKSISLEYLLSRLYDISGNQRIYNFFYVKQIVWYLLFSGKQSDSDNFIREYDESKKWLKEHSIPFSYRGSRRYTRGDSIRNTIIIRAFTVICRGGFVKPFARMFCGCRREKATIR